MRILCRKGGVAELRKIGIDDENDTVLFQKLQEHVLEHYPNPERIDCLDQETLEAFVENPAILDLTDPKFLHVLECAECTRDLIRLRRRREERLAPSVPLMLARRSQIWRFLAIGAAALALAAAVGLVGWRYRSIRRIESAANPESVSAIVDLSADGTERDAADQSTPVTASLPSSLVNLRLILPFDSPGGTYLVTVSRDRGHDRTLASASSVASVDGSKTELIVRLNLLHLQPGAYFLGTLLKGDGDPYYYPIRIRR